MLIQRLFVLRKRNRLTSNCDRGSIAVLAASAFLPLSMSFAVVADGSQIWSQKTSIQNDVEASALAVAQKWASDKSQCADFELSFVQIAERDQIDCAISPRTNGVVATVSATSSVNLHFAQLFGRNTSSISSTTSVRVGPTSQGVGVFPFSISSENTSLQNWVNSGMTSSRIYRIDVDSEDSEHEEAAPGNWAVLDLNGGSNSTSETRDWILNGYSGVVSAGQSVSGDPGIPSSALRIDRLIGKSVVLPVFKSLKLPGSNAQYEIAGFVKVQITAVKLQGESRYIKLMFQKDSMPGDSGSSNANNFGLTSWSVCSFDGKGDCS